MICGGERARIAVSQSVARGSQANISKRAKRQVKLKLKLKLFCLWASGATVDTRSRLRKTHDEGKEAGGASVGTPGRVCIQALHVFSSNAHWATLVIHTRDAVNTKTPGRSERLSPVRS